MLFYDTLQIEATPVNDAIGGPVWICANEAGEFSFLLGRQVGLDATGLPIQNRQC